MKLKDMLVVKDLIEGNSKYKKAEMTDHQFAAMASSMTGHMITFSQIARLRKALGISCFRAKKEPKPTTATRLTDLEAKVSQMYQMLTESLMNKPTNGFSSPRLDMVCAR